MPTVAVILAAAGKSSRFADKHRKKPFVELSGKAIWLRAIEPFMDLQDVKQLIVVVDPEDLEWFKEKYRPNLAFMNIDVVAGGAERADSVGNALQQLKSEIDFVAIHDAARPLLVKQWVEDIFQVAFQSGAAIPASRIVSTVKKGMNGVITETVPRENLWAAQTPQVFKRDLLEQAYQNRGLFQPTDEAQLIEKIGHVVSIVECSPLNLKITTQDDLRMAQALLQVLPKPKSLAPLHPFAADNSHLFENL